VDRNRFGGEKARKCGGGLTDESSPPSTPLSDESFTVGSSVRRSCVDFASCRWFEARRTYPAVRDDDNAKHVNDHTTRSRAVAGLSISSSSSYY